MNVYGARCFREEENGRKRARWCVWVCKTENEEEDEKEEERVSGWFIESLSGAVDCGGRRRRRGVYIAFRRRSLI